MKKEEKNKEPIQSEIQGKEEKIPALYLVQDIAATLPTAHPLGTPYILFSYRPRRRSLPTATRSIRRPALLRHCLESLYIFPHISLDAGAGAGAGAADSAS